jgi:hypothetical protein
MNDPFDYVDLPALTRIPPSSTAGLLALTEALRRRTPKVESAGLEVAVDHLDATRGEIEAELVERRSPADPPAYGSAAGLDGGVDALWGVLRAFLEAWAGFRHAGLDPFIAKGGKLGEGLAANRARAERAAAVHEQVFRGEGLSFTRARYVAQSEVMATILEVNVQRELDGDIEELAAEGLAYSLAELQVSYQAMVADRLSPDEGKRLDELGFRLRRALGDYTWQVAALLNRKQPESLELVRHALAPVVALREQVMAERRRDAGEGEGAGEGAGEGEADELELSADALASLADELLAEADAEAEAG